MLGKLKIGLVIGSLALILSACITVEVPTSDNGGQQPSNPEPPQNSTVTYTIWVQTGERDNAGTSANVYIELYGTNGNSGWFTLDTPNYNDFEKGAFDRYFHTNQDLGNIVNVCLTHDNTDDGAGWFLEEIKVESDEGGNWNFFFGQWLADDEPEGLKACR